MLGTWTLSLQDEIRVLSILEATELLEVLGHSEKRLKKIKLMATARTCFYELLGVDPKAESEDIKKGFRKQALIWHPDKNPADIDNAKRRFQLIQEAYETLSDPRDRAWYDTHRREILGGKGGNSECGEVDVWAFFSSEAFDNFGDAGKGFYKVYSDLFTRIDAEDNAWSDNPRPPRTKFGNSQSSWSDVSAFYMGWSEFATAASFAHEAPWKTRDAQTREIRRAMEAENKKAVAKAKREYNEQIRRLVAWVKRRDPRVIQRQKEQAREALLAAERAQVEKEEQEVERRKAREAQRLVELERAAEFRLLREEARARGQAFDESDAEADDSGSSEDVKTYACKPCHKPFKSEQQYRAHCQSKKHIQTCKRLKVSTEPDLPSSSSSSSEVETDSQGSEAGDHTQAKPTEAEASEVQRGEETAEGQASSGPSEHVPPSGPPAEGSDFSDSSSSDSSMDIVMGTQQSASKKTDTGKPKSPSAKKTGQKGAKKVNMEPMAAAGNEEDNELSPAGKKAAKRRRAAPENRTDPTFVCVVCKAKFDSRSKLFRHIQAEGHAALQSDVAALKKKKR